MPVLDINIIKDTIKLISLYQTNLSFQAVFDRIVAKNINATYQGRPIKLYVEVLANVSSEYKNDYRLVRNIVLNDGEGKVGALFKRVRPRDFSLLDNATKSAQQGLNYTSYSAEEIQQINKIETGSKDRKDKGIAHTKRIDEATKVEKQAEEQLIKPSQPAETKHPVPPATLPQQPHLQLPPTPGKTLPSLKTTPTLSESRSWSGRVGKARQAISNPGEFIGSFFRRGAVEKVGVTAVTEGVAGGVVKTVATRTGTRLVAGKAAAASAGKIATKLGINAVSKAVIGVAAKLGISALAGAFSAGVGTAIGILVTIATTFGDQTKTLFKYILLITIALFLLLFFMTNTQRGLKMSSFLPPYQLDGNVGISPTISPTPPGGGSCPSAEDISANRATTPETCRYLNPNISITGDLTADQIQKYKDTYRSEANRADFDARVEDIVSASRESGLNPVIFLGYWKSESLFKDGFGCKQTALEFNAQLRCAVGLSAGGSRAVQCASPKSPYKVQGCRDMKGIILGNPDIYDRSLFNFDYSHNEYLSTEEPNPITTLDALAEGHGPKSPNLSREEGVENNNCRHTYNILLEVALDVGACTARPSSGTDLSSCKFSKAGESKSYQSNKLLSYFQEVSGKTGIPAPVLAALVRVESTTNTYTISDYTDSDITTIESGLDQILTNIDAKIGATQKSICPASPTGALGLTQVQPSPDIIEQLRAQRPDGNRLAHSTSGIKLGASFAGKTYESLTLKDYCDPTTNLYLGAGVILNKLGATSWNTSWNTQEKMRELGQLYYGASTYQDDKGNTYYYGDDLWYGLENCQTSSNPCTPSSTSSIADLIKTLPGQSAVSGILADGTKFGSNNSKKVAAYSVIKLWIAATVYQAAKNNSFDLQESYTLTAADIATPGTGILNKQGKVGETYTLGKLVNYMLVYSDNAATNIVIRKLGGVDIVNNYIRQNGYSNTKLDHEMYATNANEDNYTSAEDSVTFMQKLYLKQIVDNSSSEALINILEERRQKEDPSYIYIGRNLPTGTDYVEKSGVGIGVRNDVGSIKTADGRIYLAIFLSNLTDDPAGEKAIAQIAQKAYENTQSTSGQCTPAPNPTPYCQGYSDWGNYTDSIGCPLIEIGCGPTTLAMVFSSFGQSIHPDQMLDKLHQYNARLVTCSGSYMAGNGSILFNSDGNGPSQFLSSQGYTVNTRSLANGSSFDLELASKYIKDGYLIIGSHNFKSISHIFMISDVDPTKSRITMYDPARCENIIHEENPLNMASYDSGTTNWTYAYPIKRIK